MTDISTIVVPLDGSSPAEGVLPIVRALAARTGAAIITVTSTLDGGGASAHQLDDAESRLGDLEIRRMVVSDRSPAEAVLDAVSDDAGRLVCMSTHGRGGLRRAVLGSVADELIRAGSL